MIGCPLLDRVGAKIYPAEAVTGGERQPKGIFEYETLCYVCYNMARTIPHRELRNNSSEILEQVRNGETFEVTNRGEPVAILSPPDRPATDRLRIRRVTTGGDFGKIEGIEIEDGSGDTLDELRGER